MKVAFIASPNTVISGYSNGVRSQALAWKDGLESLGVDVTLINPWHGYAWADFDLIHVFHYGMWLEEFVRRFREVNDRVIISPVVDSNVGTKLYHRFAAAPIHHLRLSSIPGALRRACALSMGILARSSHEAQLLTFGRKDFQQKLRIVPIGYSETIDAPEAVDALRSHTRFCLHVSSWHQPRKNVARLLEVFRSLSQHLVIAGNPGTPEQSANLRAIARGMQNVTILEFVSKATLRWLYSHAAVFCLPSLREGVGLVALEAAHYGAEVVITQNGGPRDYFQQKVILVDPESVESIRSGIIDAYHHPRQPALGEWVRTHFSQRGSAEKLLQAYAELVPGLRGAGSS